jgi:hypothetical protein
LSRAVHWPLRAVRRFIDHAIGDPVALPGRTEEGVGVVKPKPITPENVDELLRFLPGFEDLGQPFVVRWAGGEATEEGAVTMPYPVYAKEVDDFFRLASQECWLDPEYLAVDPARMLDDDEAIRAATLEQVRAMLTYCVRAERFGDGNWEAFLRSGRVTALLWRLEGLRSEMTLSGRHRRASAQA